MPLTEPFVCSVANFLPTNAQRQSLNSMSYSCINGQFQTLLFARFVHLNSVKKDVTTLSWVCPASTAILPKFLRLGKGATYDDEEERKLHEMMTKINFYCFA